MSPSLARTSKDLVGTTLAGRYKIIQTLSAGGMGVVYAARHVWTKREVAVKLVRPDLLSDESVIARFLREAQSAAQLEHPNVVDVLDMGRTEDGLVFMALEMLEGETLQQRMRRGAMGVEETIHLLEPILDAIVFMHERQMVHRDIKPSNIFLAATPRGVVPKLLDFGLVKILDDAKMAATQPGPELREVVTKAGHLLGTPLYSAPEQVRAEPNIGPAADVWSMGVVLYEAIAGQRPYQASDLIIAISAIASRPPTPILEVDPSVPPRVAAWIDRALSHDQASRPTMAELQAGLLEAVGSAEVAPAKDLAASTDSSDGSAEDEGEPLSVSDLEPPSVPSTVAVADTSDAPTRVQGLRAGSTFGGEPRSPSDYPTVLEEPRGAPAMGGRRGWGLSLAVLLVLSVTLTAWWATSSPPNPPAALKESSTKEATPRPAFEQVREPSVVAPVAGPVVDEPPDPAEPSAVTPPTLEAGPRGHARRGEPGRPSRMVRETVSNPLEFGL